MSKTGDFSSHDANIGLHFSVARFRITSPPGRVAPITSSMKVELIEKAAQIVGDNQLLVNIVSKRVQQLNHGSDPFVPTTPEMGCGDIALTEIIEGKIIWHEVTEEEMAEASAEDPFATLAGEEPETPAPEPQVITLTPDL